MTIKYLHQMRELERVRNALRLLRVKADKSIKQSKEQLQDMEKCLKEPNKNNG